MYNRGWKEIEMIPQIGDIDVFDSISSDDLWCLDKLILSKKLGYECGPAGIPPSVPGQYIVRPVISGVRCFLAVI